jgi:hypothetical protein
MGELLVAEGLLFGLVSAYLGSRWHPGAGWSQRATWALLMCGMGVAVIASAADPRWWVCAVSTAVLIGIAAAGWLLLSDRAPECIKAVTGWGEL